MTAPLRLAIAGCGAIAQLAHLPVLAKMRGVELVALCDNDATKARALADRFGVADVFTDLEELLDSDAIDGLIVATPNHLHEPHVLSALRAGVDVLCERPLALTTRGVERVLAAAEKSGRKVLVGNNHRFRTDVQALVAVRRIGRAGRRRGHSRRRVRAARAAGLAAAARGVRGRRVPGTGLQPPRPRAVARELRGTRAPVGAHDARRAARTRSRRRCWWASSSRASSRSASTSRGRTSASEERRWFEVLCAHGSARLAPLRIVKELNGRAVDVSPGGAAARESAFLQSYRAELAHFVAVLRGETPYEAPTDQVIVARVLETIYKAADERKEIRL